MSKNRGPTAKKTLLYFACVLLAVLLAAACSPAGRNRGNDNDSAGVGSKKYSVSQLREDFQSVRNNVENNHPLLYLYYSKANFDNYFDNAFNSIQQEMTVLEFYRFLAPVMARVNCGHTNVKPSADLENYLNNNMNVIPLGVVFSPNTTEYKAHIYQNYSSNNDIQPGTEILSINNMKVDDIRKKLVAGLFSDGLNVTRKLYHINKHFFRYYTLLIDNPANFELRCILPGSEEETVINLTARLYRDVISSFRIQNPGDDVTTLRYNMHPDLSAAVLTVKTFSTLPVSHYMSFFEDFFQKITGEGINNLIIDVRGNGGGSPWMSCELIKYLVDSEFIYFAEGLGYNELKVPLAPYDNNFNGNLFVLIDGGCFSSTGHFCSLVQYLTDAVFIGEETGGSFSCNDNHMEMTLSNTRIRSVIARTTYSTAVTGYEKGRGIMPDHKVIPTLDDKINGFDRAMEYVLNLIRQIVKLPA